MKKKTKKVGQNDEIGVLSRHVDEFLRGARESARKETPEVRERILRICTLSFAMGAWHGAQKRIDRKIAREKDEKKKEILRRSREMCKEEEDRLRIEYEKLKREHEEKINK